MNISNPVVFPGEIGSAATDRQALHRLAAIVESSHDAIISTDVAGRITSWNQGAARMFGHTEAEMLGTPLIRLIGPSSSVEESPIREQILQGGGAKIFETTRLTREGRALDVSVTASPILDANGAIVGLSDIARSITDFKEREREMVRMKQLYAALSQVNQAIVWEKTHRVLFERICRVLVDFGGFSMVWIGMANAKSLRLEPVAVAGDVEGYVASVEVYTDDRPQGRGPAGTAFRENRPTICNDLRHDPAMQPWREQIARQDLESMASFPIRIEDRVCGTLNVYSDESFFFQKKEVDLLREAAEDISFALASLELKRENDKAEQSILQERDFSQAVLDSLPGVLYLYDDTGKFLRWNQNFEHVSGYSAAEIAQMHPLDFFEGVNKEAVAERIQTTFTAGVAKVEADFLSKDGRATPYFFTGVAMQLAGKSCLIGVGIDVSERKLAEAALRENEQRFRTTLDNILEGCQLIGADWRYLYLNKGSPGLGVASFNHEFSKRGEGSIQDLQRGANPQAGRKNPPTGRE